MTVLSAVSDACTAIGLDQPNALYSSTEREHLELKVLANTCGSYIAKDYEWQALKVLATITGDGTDTTFALPSDYDRMLKDTRLWSDRYISHLTHIVSTDKWLELDIRQFSFVIGAWMLAGNEVNIKPAPASGELVKYYYMSSKWAQATGGGSTKTAFDTDTDVFRLSEELLKLCLIWKWKAMKKLPYAQEQQDYEDAKEKLIAADKGARVLRIGSARMSRGADSIAYPISITP
jgi:hypothetical protein